MSHRLVSGVKPTGHIHIGNYFGAIRQFVELQDEYESFIFIADYHALNQVPRGDELQSYIMETAAAFLAVGVDPEKVVLFRQSDISAVTELMWVFNSITPMPLLQRAHAYKDAVAKGQTVNMGLFDYPVLMAADILLYGADVVPVGKDQQQHLEMTRTIASAFNRRYGATFTLPAPRVVESVAVVTGLDGRKMSKSYGNTIGLFDDAATIRKKVMRIVTDSRTPDEPKDPETCNIFALHRMFSHAELPDLDRRYRAGQISYKESKEILAATIERTVGPLRTKKQELDRDPGFVIRVLDDGRQRAQAVAQQKISEVKHRVGLVLS